VWKQLIRRELKKSDFLIDTVALAAEYIRKVVNTTAVVLDSINRDDPYESLLPELDGIKKLHCFHLTHPKGLVYNKPGHFIFALSRSGQVQFRVWDATELISAAAVYLRSLSAPL